MAVVDCLRLPLVELPLKRYTPIEYRAMCGFVVVVVKLLCQHSCFVLSLCLTGTTGKDGSVSSVTSKWPKNE